MVRFAAHEADLKDYAHKRLRAINSLRIFGDAPDKGAIISFELQAIAGARRCGAKRCPCR